MYWGRTQQLLNLPDGATSLSFIIKRFSGTEGELLPPLVQGRGGQWSTVPRFGLIFSPCFLTLSPKQMLTLLKTRRWKILLCYIKSITSEKSQIKLFLRVTGAVQDGKVTFSSGTMCWLSLIKSNDIPTGWQTKGSPLVLNPDSTLAKPPETKYKPQNFPRKPYF